MFQSGENGGELGGFVSHEQFNFLFFFSFLFEKRKKEKGLFRELPIFTQTNKGYTRGEKKKEKRIKKVRVYRFILSTPFCQPPLSLVFRSPLLPPTNLFRPSARCSPLRRALFRSRSLCEISFGLIYIYYRVFGLFFSQYIHLKSRPWTQIQD